MSLALQALLQSLSGQVENPDAAPKLTLSDLKEASKDGSFSIYISMGHYVVCWASKVYIFKMDEFMNPDKEFGSMLAYAFVAPPEYQDDDTKEQVKAFKVVEEEEAITALQRVGGTFHRWLSISSENIVEMNKGIVAHIESQPKH